MTVREIYESTKLKGEEYLDKPILLWLPCNTTLEPDTYYEIVRSKVGSDNDVGDDYVLVIPDLE